MIQDTEIVLNRIIMVNKIKLIKDFADEMGYATHSSFGIINPTDGINYSLPDRELKIEDELTYTFAITNLCSWTWRLDTFEQFKEPSHKEV